MTTVLRRVGGGLLAAAVTVLLVWLSRAPYTAHPEPDGMIRLSWRARPEQIETCHDVPEEELEKLPAHMRQPVVCEGRSAEYRLVVRRNGTTIADEPIRGGGARHDRPIYLYREYPTPAGTYALEVRFLLADSAGEGGRTGRTNGTDEQGGRTGRTNEAQRTQTVPPVLHFSTTVEILPRQVMLVTYDVDQRRLVLRSPGGSQ